MVRYPHDMAGCSTHMPDVNWPGQRHWNMEAIHEFSARAGFWRLHRLFKDDHITVYGAATARARASDQGRQILEELWFAAALMIQRNKRCFSTRLEKASK